MSIPYTRQLDSEDFEPVSIDNPLPVQIVPPLAPSAEWLIINIPATAITANTPALIYTPSAGRRLRILGFHLGLSAASAAIFKLGASKTEKLRTGLTAANGTLNSPPGMELMGFVPGLVGDALWMDVTTTANVYGFLLLKEEAP